MNTGAVLTPPLQLHLSTPLDAVDRPGTAGGLSGNDRHCPTRPHYAHPHQELPLVLCRHRLSADLASDDAGLLGNNMGEGDTVL